jgi:hypothetical protein
MKGDNKMGFEIKYKEIDNKESIKAHLNNIINTIRCGGQVDPEIWAEYIDNTIKEENSTIEEIINTNRMINIKLIEETAMCKVIFDDSIIDKEGSYRGFTKEDLWEFIEALQLMYDTL